MGTYTSAALVELQAAAHARRKAAVESVAPLGFAPWFSTLWTALVELIIASTNKVRKWRAVRRGPAMAIDALVQNVERKMEAGGWDKARDG